jgi:DNA repair ATPase RecN
MKAFSDAQDELAALYQRQTDTLGKVHRLVSELQRAREAHEVRKIERNLSASYEELDKVKSEIRVARQCRRDVTPPAPAAQLLASMLSRIKRPPELEAVETELLSLRNQRREIVAALHLIGQGDREATRRVRELDKERVEIEQRIVNVRQRRNELFAQYAAHIATALRPLRITTAKGLLKSIQECRTAWAVMAEIAQHGSLPILVNLPSVNLSVLDTLEEFLKGVK